MNPSLKTKIQYIKNISIGFAGRNLFTYQSYRIIDNSDNVNNNCDSKISKNLTKTCDVPIEVKKHDSVSLDQEVCKHFNSTDNSHELASKITDNAGENDNKLVKNGETVNNDENSQVAVHMEDIVNVTHDVTNEYRQNSVYFNQSDNFVECDKFNENNKSFNNQVVNDSESEDEGIGNNDIHSSLSVTLCEKNDNFCDNDKDCDKHENVFEGIEENLHYTQEDCEKQSKINEENVENSDCRSENELFCQDVATYNETIENNNETIVWDKIENRLFSAQFIVGEMMELLHISDKENFEIEETPNFKDLTEVDQTKEAESNIDIQYDKFENRLFASKFIIQEIKEIISIFDENDDINLTSNETKLEESITDTNTEEHSLSKNDITITSHSEFHGNIPSLNKEDFTAFENTLAELLDILNTTSIKNIHKDVAYNANIFRNDKGLIKNNHDKKFTNARISSSDVQSKNGSDRNSDSDQSEENTNFVETLTPQYTPGQSITSPQHSGLGVEDRLANLQAQQEITTLKTEIEDLKEKLETIKVKRAEDREKLRELERMRLQLDQANEFKTKIMESQAQLQRDLARAKQEAREAQEALDVHNDETSELQEAAEMAALDKEMAEERAEALQIELEQCREKLEEATLDLQLMKAEMEAGGNTHHPYAAETGHTGYEMKQLQQQNVRLRETLVRLRDLSAHDKHEMHKLAKDLEQSKSEIAELSRTKEKLSSRTDELEAQVADLQEQVDAALGAEEMLEQLCARKLALEEQVDRLKQDVSELEALQEVHEQLVESDRELEMDLREELEMAHSATREAIREREAAMETIMDRDTTIIKFRELVHKMTEQYNELRGKVDSKQDSPAPAESESTPERHSMELGSLVAAGRASTRSIDLQLRALELSQATRRAEMLAACLPDYFVHQGGDHDAIMLILLLERLNTKSEIILGQIRERFPVVNVWDRETITKTHTAVQYSFRCQLEFQLYMIQCYVCMWREALECCAPALLVRCAGALPDCLQQERVLDAALTLLKARELDENSRLDGFERVWGYLSAMWPALGLNELEPRLTRVSLQQACCGLDALARALHSDTTAMHQILSPSDRSMELGEMHEHLRSSSETLQSMLKGIRRRLPADVALHDCGLDLELISRLRSSDGVTLNRVAATASLACRAAVSCAAVGGERGDGAPLPHASLNNIWGAATEKVYRQDDHGIVKTLKHAMSSVAGDVSRLAAFMQDKEVDIMAVKQPKEKPTPPVELRAQMIKKQLEETKSLAIKIENKDADIKELRKALKAAKEEVSEMQIRKELGERKLSTAARDAELKAEQLQRKLEDAHNQLKRKEKEFEETMDHLQQDIDSLESERGALRDKLKWFSKREARIPDDSSVKVVPGVMAGEVNEALQHQLKVLSWTVDRERAARLAACKKAERASVRALRPLENTSAPNAVARRTAAAKLQQELTALHTEWTLFVARSGLVKFPDDPSKYSRALQKHKEKQKEIRRQLEERLSALQAEVKSQLLLHRPWRCVETDLTQFAKPELQAALSCKDVEVGTIQYPASGDMADDTVYVTPTQLIALREIVAELQSDDVKINLKPLDACAA